MSEAAGKLLPFLVGLGIVLTSALGGAEDEPPPDAAAVVGGTYLRPNVQLPDGRGAYVHVTPADMPWRIAIGKPPTPPWDASSAAAREAAIQAMREWEVALRPHLPWFRLEFVEGDEEAPVQVKWKRRLAGSRAGVGRMGWRLTDEGVQVSGEMQLSTNPGPELELGVAELRRVVAHEFGHVLGLGHCLDCDSAMSYAWESRGAMTVTALDVRTFLALVEKPNGEVAVPPPVAR